MLLDKMVSKYRKNYGKVLALLKKAKNKRDTFREKARIDPLEIKLMNQFIVLENSLYKKVHYLSNFKKKFKKKLQSLDEFSEESLKKLLKEKNETIGIKLQGLIDALTIVVQTHNALENTYWKDIPGKAWRLLVRGIRHVVYPTKVNDTQVSYFMHKLSEYHDENSSFSILPDTNKATKYTDKPVNDKKFLGL